MLSCRVMSTPCRRPCLDEVHTGRVPLLWGKVFEALRNDGAEIARVVAPAADDRLALAAQEAGVPVHLLEDPKNVPGAAIAEGTELIVAAHTHARVSREALARSRLGGVGYHPSWLPRQRGSG